jgi:hypothetical protein
MLMKVRLTGTDYNSMVLELNADVSLIVSKWLTFCLPLVDSMFLNELPGKLLLISVSGVVALTAV